MNPTIEYIISNTGFLRSNVDVHRVWCDYMRHEDGSAGKQATMVGDGGSGDRLDRKDDVWEVESIAPSHSGLE